MKRPKVLVIVGAGASYDSMNSRPIKEGGDPYADLRLPLADHLFAARRSFELIRGELIDALPLVPRLSKASANRTVEDILTEIEAEANRFPFRRTQLLAIRCYIRNVIARTEREWCRQYPIATNMMSLNDSIRSALDENEQILYATFNYDRIIEAALKNAGHEIQSLADYISYGRPKLFKLHGSVDWFRPLQEFHSAIFGNTLTDQIRKLGQLAKTLNFEGQIQFIAEADYLTLVHKGNIGMPAIAVPVRNKMTFECPADHIHSLCEQLPTVTHMITIGWRAQEDHFTSLLKELVVAPPETICVSGDEESAANTSSILAQCLGTSPKIYGRGFSEFITSNQLRNFLNTFA